MSPSLFWPAIVDVSQNRSENIFCTTTDFIELKFSEKHLVGVFLFSLNYSANPWVGIVNSWMWERRNGEQTEILKIGKKCNLCPENNTLLKIGDK